MHLSIEELLQYTDEERARWEQWFRENGEELLRMRLVGDRETTMGALILHIFGPELRYVQRLRGEAPSEYRGRPCSHIDEVFGYGIETRKQMRDFVRKAAPADWDHMHELHIAGQTLHASTRKIILHAVMHEVRHSGPDSPPHARARPGSTRQPRPAKKRGPGLSFSSGNVRAIVAVVSLALFVWLGLAIRAGDTLPQDQKIRSVVREFEPAPLTAVMRALTWIGEPGMAAVLVAVAVLAFWLKGHRQEAVLMLITLLGAFVIEVTCKQVFHRARPQPFFAIHKPKSYSFPSGHALYAICLYGMLAVLGARLARTAARKVAIWTASVLMIAGIGFSRIYLGVHYPSDVLGAYLAGLGWVAGVRICYYQRS